MYVPLLSCSVNSEITHKQGETAENLRKLTEALSEVTCLKSQNKILVQEITLKEQLLDAREQEHLESLKQVAQLEKAKTEEHQAVVNLEEFWEEMTRKNDELLKEKESLESCVKTTEATLWQERISVENLRKELQEEVVKSTRSMAVLNTMISLIPANIRDFRVEKLLGTGSNAAVFKVQFNNHHGTTTPKTATDMVMKIIFNWENTPEHTLVRQKYMAELVVLSLVPNHPNVIHPLGALVIPCLPPEFVDKIPSDKKYFREELCNNKSLAILMPHCGSTLSSFLSSSTKWITLQDAQNLFVQALKAISHIESHFVVHRDIKGDNILVEPENGKLTLIDFGEAQHCPNMEMTMSATSQPWGNTGSIPPELSMLLSRSTRFSGVFSFSKCDSFALALTFWNALLPPDHKFIGSSMNNDMSTFNTQKLLREFPVPLFSSMMPAQPQLQQATEPAVVPQKSFLSRAFPSLFSSATLPQTAPPTPSPLPTQTTTVSAVVTSREEATQNNNDGAENPVAVLVGSVMIRMMNPDKAARLSAADAILALTPESTSNGKL
ncbi:hypothetical protein Pelo_18293 [Pelomyxa schiedti]|nr:hypothetical protein Pelo_18293 [Pelomyxa schiedti]